MSKAKAIDIGHLCVTRGVSVRMENPDFSVFVASSIKRHMTKDWGELGEEDKEANNDALQHGGRLLSAYEPARTGDKIWIITEADRSATTVLFPDEY